MRGYRKPSRPSLLLLVALVTCMAALLPSMVSLAQGGTLWEHEAGNTILSIAASADGSVVAIGSRDNKLSMYDGEGQLLWEYEAENSVSGVDVSADGAYIAAVSADRQVRLFDGSGELLWTFRHQFPFSDVAISEDGEYVAASSVEGRHAIFFDRAGELLWTRSLLVPVEAVDIYGTGENTRPVAGTRDSRVYILNASGDELLSIQLDDYIRDLAVSRSGAEIAVALNSGIVEVLNGGNGQIIWSYNGRRERASDRMLSVGISDDGSVVAAGISYGQVYVFDETGALIQQLQPSGEADMEAVYVTRDGRMLMYGGRNQKATVADLESQGAALAARASRMRTLTIAGGVALVAIVVGAVLAAHYTAWGAETWQATGRPIGRLARRIWRARISYIMLIPTFALLAVFNYYPAFSGLWHGFTRWTPGLRAEWVGLDNYRAAINNPYLRTGIVNAIILIAAGFAQLAVPLFVAELIFNLKSGRLQYFMRTAYVIPLVVPGVVGILLWVNIYDPNYGMANHLLRAVGLESLTRVWLGDRATALPAIIFMGFPWIGAFPLLLFYGGLISIPTELFDAAIVDGANLWRRFWHIDFPLLLTPLKTLLILGFIGGVQAFEGVFLTTAGGPGHATYVPALELYYQATRFNRMGMASAIGTILFFVILVGTILNMKYVRGSETEYQA